MPYILVIVSPVGAFGSTAGPTNTKEPWEGTATIVWTYDDEGRCLSPTWSEADGTGRTTKAVEFDEIGSSVVTEVTYLDAAGNVTRTRTDTSVHTLQDGKLVQDHDNDGFGDTCLRTDGSRSPAVPATRCT